MSQGKHRIVYMTPRDFADIIVSALVDGGYFKNDEKAHPEDLAYAFESIGRTIAASMGYLQKRLIQEEALEKNPKLTFTSNSVNDHEPEEYSEWKYNSLK